MILSTMLLVADKLKAMKPFGFGKEFEQWEKDVLAITEVLKVNGVMTRGAGEFIKACGYSGSPG